MTSWTPIRASFTASAGIALAVAVCWFSAAAAHASCGDYLQVGRTATTHLSASQVNEVRRVLASGETHRSIPTRCQGPNCGSRRPLLPSPLPNQRISPPDDQAIRIVEINPKTTIPVSCLISVSEFPSQGTPLRLERPPRV